MDFKNISILILVMIFVSCSKTPVKIEVAAPGNISKLESFFKRSEFDSKNAVNVLEKQKIIQHLTHLWNMDRGGKKYYLLEKDDITEMINSVTKGIYLDYILINKNGDIIYTKKNDELFGTNVNKGYEATPLKNCFSNKSNVFFEDISYIAPSSKVYSLYISSPVYVEGSFHGILILQVDVKKISGILEPGTEIISRDGIIRVSSFEERVFSKYTEYDKIDMAGLDSSGLILSKQAEFTLRFLKFNFKEINWVLINKER